MPDRFRPGSKRLTRPTHGRRATRRVPFRWQLPRPWLHRRVRRMRVAYCRGSRPANGSARTEGLTCGDRVPGMKSATARRAVSQMRISPSSPPDAIRLPSGLHDTDVAGTPCPGNTLDSWSRIEVQILTLPPSPPEASKPSGCHASEVTVSDMSAQGDEFAAGGRTPDFDGLVDAAGSQSLAIWLPRDGSDLVRVTERAEDRLFRGDVPDPRCVIVASRSEPFAVWAPSKSVDRTVVFSQGRDIVAGECVPEMVTVPS